MDGSHARHKNMQGRSLQVEATGDLITNCIMGLRDIGDTPWSFTEMDLFSDLGLDTLDCLLAVEEWWKVTIKLGFSM